LWLNDGSCVRLRPERQNHVWSYDFVRARTHDRTCSGQSETSKTKLGHGTTGIFTLGFLRVVLGPNFASRHMEQVAVDLKMQLVFSIPGKPRGRGSYQAFLPHR
jgi:hypothetical protein